MPFSIEFFPPKNDAAEQSFQTAAAALLPVKPTFASITYGAGGSTTTKTLATLNYIQKTYPDTPVAMHLTCVDTTKEAIAELAQNCWQQGIRHFVALRGDPKAGVGEAYTPYPGGYAYAADLVEGLKKIENFEISVAAYPETHPQALSPTADIDNLKRKQDAGADRAITQFFYDNTAFLDFRERAAKAGITMPIVVGLMPIGKFSQVAKFAAACGTKIPQDLVNQFTKLDDASQQQLGSHVFLQQCEDLAAEGVTDWHFYSMNKAQPVLTACQLLQA